MSIVSCFVLCSHSTPFQRFHLALSQGHFASVLLCFTLCNRDSIRRHKSHLSEQHCAIELTKPTTTACVCTKVWPYSKRAAMLADYGPAAFYKPYSIQLVLSVVLLLVSTSFPFSDESATKVVLSPKVSQRNRSRTSKEGLTES